MILFVFSRLALNNLFPFRCVSTHAIQYNRHIYSVGNCFFVCFSVTLVEPKKPLKVPKIKDFYISVRCSATIVSTCTIFCSFINIRVQYMAFYIFTPFDFENKNMHHSSGQHLIICYFIFIRKNITTTCITIVNGTPTVK